ncbi:MAG: murein biosynthesis integral membrane protein MurJ [Gemmatimonadales bacterium]|nr:murein biosynthesis integral membrane protein MurJ [Gemmatimonadales bacterium]
MVALGVLTSRVIGLVRLRVFGHFLGTSDAADAFAAAFRIPNLLQNLFGEGALSASFIPVYAGLLGAGRTAEANRVARAIGALLALVTSLLVLAGVLLAPHLIALIAPGFTGPKRDLTVQLVRILFPGAGLLVLSAWCLGILNSTGRFFLSYAAPVAWNAAIIVALLAVGGAAAPERLVRAAAWGSVAGSLLQVLVQLPSVAGALRDMAASASTRVREHVTTVFRNFLPAFTSRGVVQISAYADTLIATLLPAGAPAALSYAQTLYNLPVSLFGMSVSAAELPRMSGVSEDPDDARAAFLRQRLGTGLRQIAFFVVPTVVAFAALGHVLSAALFETGRFSRSDSFFVWEILAASSVGLLAGTLGRLYSSTFFALRDTRTPMRLALVRVVLGVGLAFVGALWLPRQVGLEPRLGAAGLALASSFAAWIEFALLRRALVRRIGVPEATPGFLPRLWGAAIAAALAGWGVLLLLPADLHRIVLAAWVCGVFGLVYLGVTLQLRIPEAQAFARRLARRRSRRD